jgi:hypothetical protein
MEYKIITASSAGELTKKVNELMNQNTKHTMWSPDGSHQVVETHRQNRYRGSDPIDTIITREYSQTMKKVNWK